MGLRAFSASPNILPKKHPSPSATQGILTAVNMTNGKEGMTADRIDSRMVLSSGEHVFVYLFSTEAAVLILALFSGFENLGLRV